MGATQNNTRNSKFYGGLNKNIKYRETFDNVTGLRK